MERERIDDLWLRRLDGAPLSSEEADTLLAAISADERIRGELIRDEQFHGMIQAFARSKADALQFAQQFADRLAAEADAARFVKKVGFRLEKQDRARPFGRIYWAAGLAACLVLALTAYYFSRSTPEAVAEIRSVNGDVQIIRDSKPVAAAAGAHLAPRDTLRVPSGASAQIGYVGENTTLALEPNTEAVLWNEDAAKRIQLISGSVTADVAPQPAGRPMVLLTPHLRVEVVGTRFSLDVDAGGTSIEMEHGKVKLARTEDGKTLELSAGQFAEVRQGAAFAALSLPKSGTSDFQEGSNGYAGTQDVSISTQGINPNGVVSRSRELGVWRVETTDREKYEIRGLLRFSSISIPRRARVTSARVTLAVDIWNPDWMIVGYYLKSPWNFAPNSGLGWLYRDKDQAWAEPGAKGDGTDVLAGKRFSIEGKTGNGPADHSVELDPAVVQAWLDEPSSNQGILLVNPHPDQAIRIFSSRFAELARRPKLSITWSR